ncbi:MAG: DUF1232 domain-containing protein [Micromonosporaceae bacterium]|nr:DUF1232 domain-containing protein [Micromonosporaceae bacterium]
MPRLGRKAAFSTLWTIMRGTRGGPPLGRRLAALPRMIWATLTGRYDGRARLAAMVLAAAYIVSPVDLVPEAVLLWFGLVDDAFVAVWLAGAVLAETERFLLWERERTRVIQANPVRR